MKQTILITGASSGFGLIVATRLHESGYNVIGTSRNPNQIKVPFKMLSLDIADDNSIKVFRNELFKHISHLDVLINNAGFYLSGLAEETSIEEGKRQFETNFWGTVKLTKELLPDFRKQRSGKIITVGSIMGLLNFPSASYYGASKHALEGFFKSLRFELNEFNIKVAMVEPMGFKTNIVTNAVKAETKIDDYNQYRSKIERFAKDLFGNAPEPTPVIDTLIKLVETKEPKFNHPVGKGASVILTIQHFAYKLFENSLIKNFNRFKG
ncbi:SDR family NAD(P)-dependent oxidoreductase [Leptospira bourretii]|uniref:SDR family NAD(P)-dependent oxidoreductase n=1 Tax=Leptospira bourretii TaxID=2484962 RepID=A0A4V6QLL9_9LEPT|nr:SDR family NAD(P)-dependent oxidoreductase [Leptospira bourretii]TGK90273.1 SDR family NAD(P)-dependent oxidoreductase [Leptospira bourretii]TGK93703.1 SDR family NAD(P)-dependent oxidoreductase [Leptospira bourretii]TGL22710.1 SDR family NAD(P)-dependent oxidoreductase [Leptospira bourretii]TGL42556.1 SDR family NAD(P)-dependent oxidoreductase [Leptospira bourretii]